MNSFYISCHCCIGFSLLWESAKIIRKYILEVQILRHVWHVFCSVGSSEKSVIFNYWLLYTRNVWSRNTMDYQVFINKWFFLLERTSRCISALCTVTRSSIPSGSALKFFLHFLVAYFGISMTLKGIFLLWNLSLFFLHIRLHAVFIVKEREELRKSICIDRLFQTSGHFVSILHFSQWNYTIKVK